MFERKDITRHTKAINEIVRKYCEENSLCFEPGNIKYSGTEFFYKCEIKAKGENGYPKLGEYAKLSMKMLLSGAPEAVKQAGDVRGRKVQLVDGKVVKIVGFNADRPKYCWEVEINGSIKGCANDGIMWHKGFIK